MSAALFGVSRATPSAPPVASRSARKPQAIALVRRISGVAWGVSSARVA